MRLFVLTLAASAFAYPAFASDHSRPHHRHWTGAVHAHQHILLHARRFAPALAVGPAQGFGGFAAQPSDRIYPDRYSGSFARAVPARVAVRASSHGDLDALIARHAQMNGLPESLVHRVVIRESRYNARVVGRGGAMGLMQIKYATARAMGYTGSPAGLLDPETNLTYAVRYLAGAYRAAGGNAGGAVANYAHGYYAAAKRRGFSPYAASDRGAASYAAAQPVEQVAWGSPPPRRYVGRVLRHY